MNDTHERCDTFGAWLNPALGDDAPYRLRFSTRTVGLSATKNAIIHMRQDDPRSVAHHHHRIVDRHGPRLLLGISLGAY